MGNNGQWTLRRSQISHLFLTIFACIIILQVGASLTVLRGSGFQHFDASAVSIIRFALGLVGIVFAIAVLAYRLPAMPRLCWAISLAVLLILAHRMHELRGLFAAASMFGFGYLVGNTFLHARSGDRFGQLQQTHTVALSVPLGLSIVQFLLYVLGFAGLFHPIVGWVVLVVGLTGLLPLVRSLFQNLTSPTPTVRFGMSLPPLVLLPVWGWLVAPEIQFDSLYAKAWLPSIWAQSGSITALTDHPVLNLTGSAQVLAVPGHLIGSPSTGRFLQALSAIFLVLAIYRVTSHSGSRLIQLGAMAGVLLTTTPHFLWQVTTAYDDLVICVFAVGAVVGACLLRHQTGSMSAGQSAPPVSTRHWIAFGFLVGGLASGKLHTMPLAVVLLFVCVLSTRRLAPLLISGIGALMMVSPPLVARWIQTGNPLFPQFNNVFKSRYAPPINDKLNMPFDPGSQLNDLLFLLPRTAFRTTRFAEATPNGGFGLLLVGVLAPLLLVFVKGRRPWGLVSLFPLLLWWSQLRYLRYLLPLAVVGFYLLAMESEYLGNRSTRKADRLKESNMYISAFAFSASTLLLFAAIPVTIATFWNVPGRYPADLLMKRQSRFAYLRTALPSMVAVDFLNAESRIGDRVTGDTWMRLLLRKDLDYSPFWEVLQRISRDQSSINEQVRWVVQRAEPRLDGTNLTTELSGRVPAWSRNGYEVFDLQRSTTPFTTACEIGLTAANGLCSDSRITFTNDSSGIRLKFGCDPGLIELQVARQSDQTTDMVLTTRGQLSSLFRVPSQHRNAIVYLTATEQSELAVSGPTQLVVRYTTTSNGSEQTKSSGCG
jgi:hypothetical protein